MVTHVGYRNIQPVNGESRTLREAAAPSDVQPAPAPRQPAVSPSGPGETIPALDVRTLDSVVEDVSRNVHTKQRSLQFSVDERSGRTIITVIDKETEEIIRQIPPEEVVALAEHLEGGRGFLIKAEA